MGLTTNQREMLYTAARKGVYRESPPYSDEFEELVAAFGSWAADHRDYVRFEGAYYLTWRRLSTTTEAPG